MRRQVLLSGCSAVPPLFFRLLFDPSLSPCRNPLDAVPPNDPTLRHIKLFLRWKLFGEEEGGAEEQEQGPPPPDDFTRGAELFPIPWVRALGSAVGAMMRGSER